MKNFLKSIIPESIFSVYLKIFEYLAAVWYGFPSKKMIVIGVTGTKGKSTVVRLIGHVLERAGHKVGWTSSIDFKIGEKILPNATKMTMPGRFMMQKKLAQMANDGCRYAIIETSSEGLAQFRHIGIDYDAAILTNLSPEHIERHKGFENYKKAKMTLFGSLKKNQNKKIRGQEIKKTIIVNAASEYADDFFKFSADRKIGYAVLETKAKNKIKTDENIFADRINLSLSGSDFVLRVPQESAEINSPLLGKFNIENALAAASFAFSQGIDLEVIKGALDSFKGATGRMEKIDAPGGFTVFIDYAHEPKSLESVYQYCRSLIPKETGKKLICVLGAAGGGRDTWKRPVMGGLSSQYCDHVILTNEDPYDEPPDKIIKEIIAGCSGTQDSMPKIQEIIDREEAINKALSLARIGDIVILTGKGSESCIMGPNGAKIYWNEKEIVEKLLKKQIITHK